MPANTGEAKTGDRQMKIEHVPGYAAEVWGGFVWVDGDGNEQRWSKRSTLGECEATALETCNRLGIEEAFA